MPASAVWSPSDGAEHHFMPTLHTDAGETDDAAEFTRDGTYLRMRETGTVQAPRRVIEFPNGEVHEFAPSTTSLGSDLWRLVRIGNAFAENFLSIAYTDDPAGDVWVLTDSYGRTHRVEFAPQLADGEDVQMVDSVEVAVFNRALVDSTSSFPSTATYNFIYTNTEIGRPAWGGDPKSVGTTVRTIVPLLTKIELPAEDAGGRTSFELLHYTATTPSDRNGLPRRLKLPTQGCIGWKWDNYSKPVPSAIASHMQYSTGVIRRTLYPRSCPADTDSDSVAQSQGIASWIYVPQMRWDDIPAWDAPNEMTNTVTDPENNFTINYFSVATDAVEGWEPKNYGLPFTERLRRGNRFLSRRSYEAGKLIADPARSEYVRYERDGGDSLIAADQRNVRPAASETVHYRGGETSIVSESSAFDGFGHYRTSRTTGDVSVPTDRTATTMYNETRGSYPGSTPLSFPASWILGTFSYAKVTENGETYRSDYVFDQTTGFLQRRRRRKDTSADPIAGSHDVIEVFTPDDRGNVTREEYYGGDRHGTGTGDDHTVPTGDLATMTLPAVANRIAAIQTEHAQPNEGLFDTYSEYLEPDNIPFTFAVEDYTIDKNTGLPSKSRDTAKLQTLYGYDWAARPTFVRSPGRAATFYTYTRAQYETGLDTRAAVKVEQKDHATETIIRTKVRYEFDDLGRLTDEWQTMPAGTESQRRIVYDKLGRRHQVSELGNITVVTTTTFDAFGRPTKVTAPDLSAVDFLYAGIGQRTQLSKIATSTTAEQEISRSERYDAFGRLVRVVEKSGPTNLAAPVGNDVTTEYRYDAADRLRRVTMGEGGTGKPSQERLFDYDGRGFLRWESHPESGVTSYTYDARGKLLRKIVGAADSLFDLKNEYDLAERLSYVQGRDPETALFRPLKYFQYAAENDVGHGDWKNGKLVWAQRFNYAGELEPDYTVNHSYYYDDPAGRRVRRDTSIFKEGVSTAMKSIYYGVTYNDLDLVESIDYPMCTGCGAPPVDPLREDLHVYSYGRLIRLEGVVGSTANPITYWPNGMRRLMRHENGIEDGQEVGTMVRPTEISFRTYDRCVRPTITNHPKGGTAPTQLSVSLTQTAGLRFEWKNAATHQSVGTGQVLDVASVTTATSYYVVVTNACGIETSQTATVTPSGCVTPSTGSIVAVRQPDGSFILRPNPITRANPTYEWRVVGNPAVIHSFETYPLAAPAVTTTYSLTIIDACGSVTSNVTIIVPLLIATTLNATWNGSAIAVTWQAVTGAVDYVVQRRAGAEWSSVGSVATPAFTDTDIVASRTYAYRVYARGNGPDTYSKFSNSDVATTKTYSNVVPNTLITSAAFDDLLDAVNKVRGAAGWPAVGWGNILAPTDVLPSPGERITARHVIACRARMTEALQAVGARPLVYNHADPTFQLITAATLNEVLEQAR
jgi:hypothetical protein